LTSLKRLQSHGGDHHEQDDDHRDRHPLAVRQRRDREPQRAENQRDHDADEDDPAEIADELIKDLNSQKIWDRPIVTEVSKLDKFYMAEDYHQEYFARNAYQPYCQAVVAPKVSKFRKHFLEMLKKQPV